MHQFLSFALVFIFPSLSPALPQSQDAALSGSASNLVTGSASEYIGDASDWSHYLVVQVPPYTNWVGPDRSHITQAVTVATSNGQTVSTTTDIDISVQPTTTNGPIGAEQPVLLSPSLVSDLTSAAQQACGKRRKRSPSASCLNNFQNSANSLISKAFSKQALEVGAGVLAADVALVIVKMYAENEQIPNAVDVPVGPTSTLSVVTSSVGASSSSTSISSISSITSPATTSTMDADGKAKSSSASSTSTVTMDACWVYTGTDIDSLGLDSDALAVVKENNATRKRLRDTNHDLVRRDRETANQLGTCPSQNNLGIRAEPPYWPKTEIMGQLPDDLWWYVPSQAMRTGPANGQQCNVASIQHVGKRDPLDPTIGQSNFPPPYNSQPLGLTVEHVYELSNLKYFWNDQFKNANDPRCSDFISVFTKVDGRQTDASKFDSKGKSLNKNDPAQYKDSRLQSLWNEMPNKLNKAFIGLQGTVNGVKGCIFNPDCDGMKKLKTGKSDGDINSNLNLWNDIGMAMQLMTIDPVQQQYQKVHEKIYEALASFDVIQACEIQGATTSWADTYASWMDTFLQDEQKAAASKVSSLSVYFNKPEVTLTNGKKNMYGYAADNMAATYGPNAISAGSLTFDRAKLLSLAPKTTLGILKRDGPVCSTSTSSSSTTSSAPPPPPSSPVPTICPAPGNLKNLAQNRCDQKCMGAGWGNCDQDTPERTEYTCYCNPGPCSGQQCGDPVKIDNLTNKGTKCPPQSGTTFGDDNACDLACPGGVYGTRGTCYEVDPKTHKYILDGNGNKQHRMMGGTPACSCDQDPCKNFNCYDRIAQMSQG